MNRREFVVAAVGLPLVDNLAPVENLPWAAGAVIDLSVMDHKRVHGFGRVGCWPCGADHTDVYRRFVAGEIDEHVCPCGGSSIRRTA